MALTEQVLFYLDSTSLEMVLMAQLEQMVLVEVELAVERETIIIVMQLAAVELVVQAEPEEAELELELLVPEAHIPYSYILAVYQVILLTQILLPAL